VGLQVSWESYFEDRVNELLTALERIAQALERIADSAEREETRMNG
jgi:uncharacterized protein YukE